MNAPALCRQPRTSVRESDRNSTLEALPAGFGDCLLISCPVGRRTWRLLVDTGPDETYPGLEARLAQLPADTHGNRHIDLFIVTHIDHDHIGGAALLLNDSSLGLTFGDIRFNAPPQPAVRGVAEGEALAQLLGATAIALPWNRAFDGKAAVTSGDGGFAEVAMPPDAPQLTLLSPTPARLKSLYRVWDRELERLRNKERDVPGLVEPVPRDLVNLDLKALAAKITGVDHSVPNGSSAVFFTRGRPLAIGTRSRKAAVRIVDRALLARLHLPPNRGAILQHPPAAQRVTFRRAARS